MTGTVLRAALRVAAGVGLLLAFVLLVGAATIWLSPLAASLMGGLAIAVMLRLATERGGSASGPPSGGPPAPPRSAASAVSGDADRVIAWCRAVLAGRIPPRGRFERITETLVPESRPLAGLAIHLAAAPFRGDDPAHDDLRILTLRVEGEDGAYLQSDVDTGSATELIARLDAGERTSWVTRLLERAGEEVWRSEVDGRARDPA